MKLDIDRLEACGMRVELAEGGVRIATKTMREAQFVPMEGDDLKFALTKSAFHREINAAIGGINPKMPGER